MVTVMSSPTSILFCCCRLEISPRKEAKDWEKRTALASKLTLVVLPYHSNFHFFSLVPLFKIFVVYLVKFMVVVTF